MSSHNALCHMYTTCFHLSRPCFGYPDPQHHPIMSSSSCLVYVLFLASKLPNIHIWISRYLFMDIIQVFKYPSFSHWNLSISRLYIKISSCWHHLYMQLSNLLNLCASWRPTLILTIASPQLPTIWLDCWHPIDHMLILYTIVLL